MCVRTSIPDDEKRLSCDGSIPDPRTKCIEDDACIITCLLESSVFVVAHAESHTQYPETPTIRPDIL